MSQEVTAKNWSGFSIFLKVCLNAIDLFVAFFLVLGGANATVSHPITGSICMVMAPFLIFLSIGLWTASRQKLIIHAVLYWGAFSVLGVSIAVAIAVRALHNSEDTWVILGVVAVFFAAALFSTIEFRLNRNTCSDPPL
jgi:hypothetical protein